MDELILKTAVCIFLMFVMLGKALRGLFFTLWPKGNITTLEKTMDLAWDKVVEYNGVSKGDGSNKAM